MNIKEKELEDWLVENEMDYFYNGENPEFTIYRQFDIAPYGIMDIVAVRKKDGIIEIEVWELKSEELNISHIKQLYSYIGGLTRNIPEKVNVLIKPKLLFYKEGNSIDESIYVIQFLKERTFSPILHIKGLDLYSYCVTLDEGIVITNENPEDYKRDNAIKKSQIDLLLCRKNRG